MCFGAQAEQIVMAAVSRLRVYTKRKDSHRVGFLYESRETPDARQDGKEFRLHVRGPPHREGNTESITAADGCIALVARGSLMARGEPFERDAADRQRPYRSRGPAPRVLRSMRRNTNRRTKTIIPV